jgi:hypothetical protein
LTASPKKKSEHVLKKPSFLQERRKLVEVENERIKILSASEIAL